MSFRLPLGLCVVALAGCVDESAPKDAEKAAVAIEQDAVDDLIKKDQLSIEEAAEKATKLIEEDAKAQIDASAVVGGQTNQ